MIEKNALYFLSQMSHSAGGIPSSRAQTCGKKTSMIKETRIY